VEIARSPTEDEDRERYRWGIPMSKSPDQIKAMIEERFVKVALDPTGERKFPVGPDSAKRLGYDAAEIDALPPQATESFAGVGNPLALGELRAGAVVLDLGCGAGMDSILASRRVGPKGRVIGVDMTGPMVQKARANASAAGVGNVEFHRAEADRLPVGDGSVDVVISNGVFNLCPDKPGVLAEVFRVLRPGSWLRMADILLDDAVTPEEVERRGAWSD
jgi:SAM-dependent methyltransferase